MIVDRIKAALDRDPAVHGFWGVLEVLFTYAGFHALFLHDVARSLHRLHLPLVPRLISHGARLLTGVEIHPAATIGKSVFIDHGMGVVIGETAEVGDGTTLFQGVTLGGTGKQTGKRHPTVGRDVVIGVRASILGNVSVGDGSYVGAGAVVLKDVPPNSTAVGVPARIVRAAGRKVLGATLDHTSLPDPVLERLQALQEELERTEQMVEMEAALPHVFLAISTPDVTRGREGIERILSARHVAYGVHETDAGVRLTATLCHRDCEHVRRQIDGREEFTVVSEGREPDLRGAQETRPPLEADQPCDGGRVLKLVIALTQG